MDKDRSIMVNSAIDLIGNTPMICLRKLTGMSIYGKAEFLNPGGSIKDRIAKYMIEKAEERGVLKKGMTIMEPTSGNTGIGIAFVGVQRGYKVVIVMPENMSDERKKLIKSLGAELILTPAIESIGGSVEEVKRRAGEDKSIFIPQQFENQDNPNTHYMSTGPEIWQQLEGKIDVFVSGLGSGGTLTGIGRFLKEKNPECKIVAVEPKNVSALLGHRPGIHKIQGIGDGFIPQVMDTSIIDEIIEVEDDDAITVSRELATTQGILAGISSGANIWAACRVGEKIGNDKVIATILVDRAERYFSAGLFEVQK